MARAIKGAAKGLSRASSTEASPGVPESEASRDWARMGVDEEKALPRAGADRSGYTDFSGDAPELETSRD
jgi:hypothetical protein